MDSRRYAAIDIGSNAVRLLIKEAILCEGADRPRMDKALLLRVPLRLGFDSFLYGDVSEAKAEKLLRLMKSHRQLMRIYEVDAYRACATSAMRDASNGGAIIRRIRKATGIDIEIIGGQEEARLIYGNRVEYATEEGASLAFVDVGGGSTEINLMVGGELVHSSSHDIGTVRMLTGKVAPESWERLGREMGALAREYGRIDIVGSGGNMNRLYRMAPRKDKKNRLMDVETLRSLHRELSGLTVEGRMEAYGLKADRADVIVPAAEIFLAVAGMTRAGYIQVPGLGLADGIVDALYARDAAKPAPLT